MTLLYWIMLVVAVVCWCIVAGILAYEGAYALEEHNMIHRPHVGRHRG